MLVTAVGVFFRQWHAGPSTCHQTHAPLLFKSVLLTHEIARACESDQPLFGAHLLVTKRCGGSHVHDANILVSMHCATLCESWYGLPRILAVAVVLCYLEVDVRQIPRFEAWRPEHIRFASASLVTQLSSSTPWRKHPLHNVDRSSGCLGSRTSRSAVAVGVLLFVPCGHHGWSLAGIVKTTAPHAPPGHDVSIERALLGDDEVGDGHGF